MVNRKPLHFVLKRIHSVIPCKLLRNLGIDASDDAVSYNVKDGW